jgi:hypothetical protein
MDVTEPPVGDSYRARRIRVNFLACLLLIAQFLLGMVANLFVTIPSHHPGASASNYFGGVVSGITWVIPHGPAWLAAHAVLGLLLVLAALASLAESLPRSGRLTKATAILGALAIIGAGFNGASFLNYGQNFSSMIMAGLWALALACYLTGLFADAKASMVDPQRNGVMRGEDTNGSAPASG